MLFLLFVPPYFRCSVVLTLGPTISLDSSSKSLAPISPLISLASPAAIATPTALSTQVLPEESVVPVINQSAMTPVPLTPEPWIPPTPYPEDKVVSNPSDTITLMVPKGWYASFSETSQGTTVIANFELWALEGRPEGGIMVELGIGNLKEGQTFDQWLVERREYLESDPYGPGPTFITDDQPISVSTYSGVTYDIGQIMDDGREHTFQSIYLLVDDLWVTGVVIKPLPSPDYQKALSILHTLRLTPHDK
jgi:hypothetical protein